MADSPPRTLRITAYAKINLTLEVLGCRPDGFHEVRTVMQSISLTDRLTLAPAAELSFACSNCDIPGESNLVMRAARLLRDKTGTAAGASLLLEKRIPIAAGLGGGSTDAAATLVGLNRLWNLGLTDDDLLPIAAELGSDVTFFLQGGTALASGRGEILEALPRPQDQTWFVLLTPPAGPTNKTARLYGALSVEDFTGGQASQRLADALRGGAASDELFMNAFTRVTRNLFPNLDSYAEAFRHAGAREVHLSGAGPTLFAAAEDRAVGREIVERLDTMGYAAQLVRTVDAGWTVESDRQTHRRTLPHPQNLS